LSLEQNNDQGGQYDKGLLSILELFGNAMDLIQMYEREEAERMQKEVEVSEGSRMLEKVEELDDEQEDTKTAHNRRGMSRDSRKMRDYQSDGMANNK
jgi:hypothetical protein